MISLESYTLAELYAPIRANAIPLSNKLSLSYDYKVDVLLKYHLKLQIHF